MFVFSRGTRGWIDGSEARFAAKAEDLTSTPGYHLMEGKIQLLLSSGLNMYVCCIIPIPTQALKINTLNVIVVIIIIT